MIPGSTNRVPKLALIGGGVLAVALVVVVVLLVSGGDSSDDSNKNAAATGKAPASTQKQAPAPATAPKADEIPSPSSNAPSGGSAPASKGTGYPNGNLSNTRNAKGSITAQTVSGLKQAWTIPLGKESQSQYGSYASTPVVVDGVVYSQDLASNVSAIDLKSGKVFWTKSYNSPDQGPNGVVVGDGLVMGATATGPFALEQQTGKQRWGYAVVKSGEGVDMAPGYHKGVMYVSTVPGNNQKFYGGGTRGILFGFSAAKGELKLTWDTAPIESWSKKSADAKINLGGGLWYPPAFDSAGDMYFGVGNAGPFPGTDDKPWGKSRPGKNLYTNSLVKLDPKTNKVKWYYQLTPHDLYDWDLQDPPILETVKGRPAVLTAGKAGFVIAVDRKTGKLLWKRSVGKHNGHDNDPLFASKGQYSKLHLGEEVYPGRLGGVIAPMSTDGKTLFVPVVNNSVTYDSQEQAQDGTTATGEVVAVDIDTGKVKWKQEFPTPAFGATTVSNDLVFATTFDGMLHALNTKTGKPVWEQQLPAGTNSGVTVSGDTVIAPAGMAVSQGQTPSITAYRLEK
jgi:glucose dehydrogenase